MVWKMGGEKVAMLGKWGGEKEQMLGNSDSPPISERQGGKNTTIWGEIHFFRGDKYYHFMGGNFYDGGKFPPISKSTSILY